MGVNTEPKRAIQYELLPEKVFCKAKITEVKAVDRNYQGQVSKGIRFEFTALDHVATNNKGEKVPILLYHTTGVSMKFKDTLGNVNKLLTDIIKPEKPYDESQSVDVEALCLGKDIEVMVSHYIGKDTTKKMKLAMVK
jgi:hypothetical protein